MTISFKKRPARSLRSKLLGVFIIYGLSLLALLWAMQMGLAQQYYEHSMQKKCERSMSSISTLYSRSESLSYDVFSERLGKLAADNDIYFVVEAKDGSFSFSSTDTNSFGRLNFNSDRLINDARIMLRASAKDTINYTRPDVSGRDIMVYASFVESDYRAPVFIYALSFLEPIGPAVNIMRSQLLVVSIAVFVLAVIIAFVTSARMAKPMTDMSNEAKKLGDGDFDVDFKGADYNEINELASALNDSAAKLKSSDALQKDLMANVSHDIRTPLTMIKSYAEMIRDLSGDNKEKREEHLGVIIEETDRLAVLVGDILELSKVQSGADEFKTEIFDLKKAAEEIWQTYKIVETEGFDIRFEAPEEAVPVRGDEGRIKQVISNLVSNAVKYSEDRKEIRIYFERHGEKIRLCVEDKGIGIEDDQLEKIWDRYQRASKKSRRSKEGSGLGLSICSEILKRHKADYGVYSTPGKGSTFWFEMFTEKTLD